MTVHRKKNELRDPSGLPRKKAQEAEGKNAREFPPEVVQMIRAGVSPTSLGQADPMARSRTVAALQRSAGNTAVGAMLARQGGGTAVADPALDPTQLTQSDIMFKRLPPGRGWLTGTGRNQRAQDLHDEFEHVFDVSQEAESVMSFLHWTEETMGPRQLTAIEAIAPTVSKKSKGDAGEKLRNAVDQ